MESGKHQITDTPKHTGGGSEVVKSPIDSQANTIRKYTMLVNGVEEQLHTLNESRMENTGIVGGLGDWIGEKTGAYGTGKEIYEGQIKQAQDRAKTLHTQILTEFRGKTLSPLEQTSIEQVTTRLEKLSGTKLAKVSWADAVLTSTDGTKDPANYLTRATIGAMEGAYEGVAGIMEIAGTALGVLAAYSLEPKARDIIENDISEIVSQLTLENAEKLLAALPGALEEFSKLPADKQVEGATKLIGMIVVPLGIGAIGIKVGKAIVQSGITTANTGAETTSRAAQIISKQAQRASGVSKNAMRVAGKASIAGVTAMTLGTGTATAGATAIVGGSAVRYVGEMGGGKLTPAEKVARAEKHSGVLWGEVTYNADLSDTERYSLASSLLWRKLTDKQELAIFAIHNYVSKGVYENEYKELRLMVEHLDRAGFSREEGRKLMEHGILGSTGMLDRVKALFAGPRKPEIIQVQPSVIHGKPESITNPFPKQSEVPKKLEPESLKKGTGFTKAISTEPPSPEIISQKSTGFTKPILKESPFPKNIQQGWSVDLKFTGSLKIIDDDFRATWTVLSVEYTGGGIRIRNDRNDYNPILPFIGEWQIAQGGIFLKQGTSVTVNECVRIEYKGGSNVVVTDVRSSTKSDWTIGLVDYHRPVVRESTPLARPEPKPPRSLSKGQLSLEELKRREIQEKNYWDEDWYKERVAREKELRKTPEGQALLAREKEELTERIKRDDAIRAWLVKHPTITRVLNETEQHIFEWVEVVHDGNKWRARGANWFIDDQNPQLAQEINKYAQGRAQVENLDPTKDNTKNFPQYKN